MKRFACIAMLIMSQTANALIYAQLSSTQTQFIEKTTINEATAITALPISGLISGIEWNEKQKLLTIKEDGVYVIISNVQYGTRHINENQTGGNFFYWLEADGKPLTNSSHTLYIEPSPELSLIEYYYVSPLTAGTQLRFMFSSNAHNIGIVSFPGNTFHPTSPAFTVSIFKVGNIVTYM